MFVEEVWKDIPYYEGLYQVSNFGRVRSIERIEYTNRYNKNGKHIKKRILCPRVCGKKKKIIIQLHYLKMELGKNIEYID